MFRLILGVAAIPAALITIAGYSAKSHEGSILESAEALPPYKVRGPKVSVIIPTFVEEAYITPTLEAIRSQTYEPIEIVVSDASPQESMLATQRVIAPYGAVMVHTDVKSISYGRNLGAQAATGEILIFLDADCIVPSDFVEKLVANLYEPGVKLAHGTDVYYGDASFLLQAGKSLARWFKAPVYTTGRGICMRKSDFWSVGGYSEECDAMQGCREDKDLGQRVLAKWGAAALYLDRTAICAEAYRRPMAPLPWMHRGWREGRTVDRQVK